MFVKDEKVTTTTNHTPHKHHHHHSHNSPNSRVYAGYDEIGGTRTSGLPTLALGITTLAVLTSLWISFGF